MPWRTRRPAWRSTNASSRPGGGPVATQDVAQQVVVLLGVPPRLLDHVRAGPPVARKAVEVRIARSRDQLVAPVRQRPCDQIRGHPPHCNPITNIGREIRRSPIVIRAIGGHSLSAMPNLADLLSRSAAA